MPRRSEARAEAERRIIAAVESIGMELRPRELSRAARVGAVLIRCRAEECGAAQGNALTRAIGLWPALVTLGFRMRYDRAGEAAAAFVASLAWPDDEARRRAMAGVRALRIP